MDKKYLIAFVLGMFMISLVSCCGETVTRGEPVNLIFPSNATSLNITVEYPNQSSFIALNQAMTKVGYSFIYNLSGTYTQELGLIRYYACDGNGDCAYTCSKLVTASGFNESLIFFIIMYIAFFGAMIYGISIKNAWVSLIGCFGLLITGIYTSTNGFSLYKNLLTNVISYVSIGLGLGIGFEALMEISNK